MLCEVLRMQEAQWQNRYEVPFDQNWNPQPITGACRSCDLKNHPLSLLNSTKITASKYFAELKSIAEEGNLAAVNFFIDRLVSSYFDEVKRLCDEMKAEVLSANWKQNAYFYPFANAFADLVHRKIISVDNDPSQDHFFYIGYTQFAWLDYLCTTGSKSEQFEEGYKHLHRIEFYISRQTCDINEAKLIEDYGKHSNVINMARSYKSIADGYVYLVVFAKRSGCGKTVDDIKQLIFNAKYALKVVSN